MVQCSVRLCFKSRAVFYRLRHCVLPLEWMLTHSGGIGNNGHNVAALLLNIILKSCRRINNIILFIILFCRVEVSFYLLFVHIPTYILFKEQKRRRFVSHSTSFWRHFCTLQCYSFFATMLCVSGKLKLQIIVGLFSFVAIILYFFSDFWNMY